MAIREYKFLTGQLPTSDDIVNMISIRYCDGRPLTGDEIRQTRDVILNGTQRGGTIRETVTTRFDIAGEGE